MKTSTHTQTEDQFGHLVTRALSANLEQMPYEVQERLRAARMRAVAARRVSPILVTRPQAQAMGDGTLTLGAPWKGWTPLASLFPMVLLVVGLFTINVVLDEYRANEVAEVDAALLTDDLPPSAYTDPGFVQFLKLSDSEKTD
jgi:Protein of unknown function (DUF3619)